MQINNGNRYKDKTGVCVKGLLLIKLGYDPALWDCDRSVRAGLQYNQIINRHLEIWNKLTPIERDLRDRRITPQEAFELATKEMKAHAA